MKEFDERFNNRLWPIHDCREDEFGNLHTWPESTKSFLSQSIDRLLTEVEKKITDERRIRGETSYMWPVTNDTPVEIRRHDENHKIIGYNAALDTCLQIIKEVRG